MPIRMGQLEVADYETSDLHYGEDGWAEEREPLGLGAVSMLHWLVLLLTD